MKVSNSTFNSLVQRYSHKDGKIYFDDYIHCIARLTTMFGTYKLAVFFSHRNYGYDFVKNQKTVDIFALIFISVEWMIKSRT